MDTPPPPIVRGLYPIEHDESRLTFAWTRDRLSVNLPGLDRRHPWIFVLRFKGGRGDTASLPDISVDIDGGTRATVRASNALQDLRVPLPTSPGRSRGARIVVNVSNTFVPGPADPRALGVVVDELRIEPPNEGVPVVPVRVLAVSTLAGAMFGAAFALIGLAIDGAVIAVVTLTLGQAAALTRGSAPYADSLDRVPWIALSIAVPLVLLVALASRWPSTGAGIRDTVSSEVFRARGVKLRNTALFAACFTAGVLYLKLLVLLHPDMPIGDALFQAHRFEWVQAGRWLFTSVAPGLYEFPYAIGLYVFSLPFATLVTTTSGYMALLRVVAASVDAVAGLLLYPAVARSTGDRLAAAAAVATFHLIPLNFRVQTVGNLTNVFGQALFVMALVVILIGFGNGRRLASAVLLTALAASAMLSHTSTFAILVVVLGLTALALAIVRRPDASPRGGTVLAATLAATAIAVGLYYAHFGATYAAQYARITGELAQPVAAATPRGSAAGRAEMVPYYLSIYYGWPLMLMAAIGASSLRASRSTLALLLWCWLGACVLFLILGIMTPVDLRHYLAAFPAVAVLAGLGMSQLWRAGMVGRVATCALLGWALVIAVRDWLGVL